MLIANLKNKNEELVEDTNVTDHSYYLMCVSVILIRLTVIWYIRYC
jgi:hypothetical protein